ncbi:MAG: molybdopterin-synthase adenylyltransferase MoeB [Rhodospirillales bacterium]|jgi:adenylyltransferase/sulfurtransferase|nr:adenylyltransferase [Rhodospirillaceae bacterium]MDP6427493.1 molybdopterin-synthase adenylyltransferase MoeB [Rhodospirillales bacterium]MDP6646253.1 molybdopterin-synthase adenylyltransferase MoeB [Rhodospirillales bacterium]|tara:strand:- start:492 stop:1271 length:780 start_codon:yes stop_codon:yes gene_type:complete
MDDQELKRYARHILLPEIGGPGQARLLGARVLVIGAGGLGSPVILYLAAAGIGTIGIIDDDEVDLSNLQRQVVHTTARIGAAKTESARQAVAAINPGITVNLLNKRLTRENAAAIIAEYDIVADGSDNFETRFLVNDACYLAGKTLVSAAILRFDGQLSTFKAHAGEDHPCYRCLFPEPPPPDLVPSCAEAGVLGALCGIMGSLQAAEVIKEITGAGDSLSGSLLIFDGLRTDFRKIKIRPDPGCALCGPQATIHGLGA